MKLTKKKKSVSQSRDVTSQLWSVREEGERGVGRRESLGPFPRFCDDRLAPMTFSQTNETESDPEVSAEESSHVGCSKSRVRVEAENKPAGIRTRA